MTHLCIKTISRFRALNIPWTSPTSMSRRFEQHHGIHLCRLGCWMLAGRKCRLKKVDGLVGLVGPRQRQHCCECFLQHVEWMFLFGVSSNSCVPESGVFHGTSSYGSLICIPSPELLFLGALRTMCWFMLNLPWRSKVHLLTLLSSIQICQWPTSFGWVRTGYLEWVGLQSQMYVTCASDIFLETPEGFHRSWPERLGF